MNPIRITCNGSDISSSVQWSSISFLSQLTKDVGTSVFNVLQNAANLAGVTVPIVGDTIGLYDSTGLIWAGTVSYGSSPSRGIGGRFSRTHRPAAVKFRLYTILYIRIARGAKPDSRATCIFNNLRVFNGVQRSKSLQPPHVARVS